MRHLVVRSDSLHFAVRAAAVRRRERRRDPGERVEGPVQDQRAHLVEGVARGNRPRPENAHLRSGQTHICACCYRTPVGHQKHRINPYRRGNSFGGLEESEGVQCVDEVAAGRADVPDDAPDQQGGDGGVAAGVPVAGQELGRQAVEGGVAGGLHADDGADSSGNRGGAHHEHVRHRQERPHRLLRVHQRNHRQTQTALEGAAPCGLLYFRPRMCLSDHAFRTTTATSVRPS